MRIITVIRILAGLIVLMVVVVTATLSYHVHVKPVGGLLTRLLPEPGSMDPHREAIEFARHLDSRELPDIEPGEQAFGKAVQMMAQGRMRQAHAKLTTIFNIFPNSSVARTARRIVGDMNMDELLGSRTGFGRKIHRVRPGDSYFAIAASHDTTIEMIIYLNSMMELDDIQPGDELLVMPLNYRLLVEPRRQAISIWDEGRFLREYTALSMKGLPSGSTSLTIKQKTAVLNGGNVPSYDENYCAAEKVIQLASSPLQIRTMPEIGEDGVLPNGILLKREDMEELNLLTRSGNIVGIR